jgi:hypothetical protein
MREEDAVKLLQESKDLKEVCDSRTLTLSLWPQGDLEQEKNPTHAASKAFCTEVEIQNMCLDHLFPYHQEFTYHSNMYIRRIGYFPEK